ncbi:zinc-ribbon domain-containing protein [Bosea vaviloviae]|uniref:Zinc finger/thioredoxin putative domain-containing protein n=1 Tax=Bosea vaviloviae TaxID=1526658 RepID=A0A0N0MAT3_9HYPH|nr:DUF3426 domain-containing protein [Bosea vaviloviae]KPH80034.1 hypothetical protein AE618_16025 [Bosea vaviloviae]
MLIVCPSCASRYELDAAKLGPDGRKVRCASCQTLWHVMPEAFPDAPTAEETQALLNEELAQAAAIEAEVSAVAAEKGDDIEIDAAPAPAPRKQGTGRSGRKPSLKGAKTRLAGAAIPAMLGLAGFALLGLLVWQRERAVRSAPQLASVFEAVGLPVNVRGLKLGAIESGLIEDSGGRFLVVEGDVTNIARVNTAVPPIEVSVKDGAGQTLYSWKTDPPRAELEPSELMRFRARLAAPPATGQTVLVRFAASGAVGAAGTH